MIWFVPAEHYVDQWKPLPIDTGRGLGVLVFDYWWRARDFIEANWEPSLGPGWEPLELNSAQLVYVLERLADEEDVKWVVSNAPPLPGGVPWGTEGGPPEEQVKAANIQDFIDALRGSDRKSVV